MRRIVMYDLNYADNDDYTELYNFLDELKAKKLTESCYLVDTTIEINTFKSKLASLTKKGDNVKVIYSSNKYNIDVTNVLHN